MSDKERSSVSVYSDTWKRLNARKQPGDSFDDVVNRLLDETKESTDNADMEVSA